MTKIIRAEIYKYFKSNIIKIMMFLGVVFALVQCLSLIGLLYVNIGVLSDEQIHLIQGHEAFAVADMASIFTFFVPFMVVFSFTSEFSKKTFGNLLGYNISKKQLFVSKYVAFCIIVVVISIVLAAASTGIATCSNGWGVSFHISQLVEILLLVVRVSLVQIASSSLIIIASLYIHNDGAIVILYFVFSLIESIVAAFASRIEASNSVLRFLVNSMPTNCIDSFQMINASNYIVACGLFYSLSSILLCVLMGSWLIDKLDINY